MLNINTDRKWPLIVINSHERKFWSLFGNSDVNTHRIKQMCVYVRNANNASTNRTHSPMTSPKILSEQAQQS